MRLIKLFVALVLSYSVLLFISCTAKSKGQKVAYEQGSFSSSRSEALDRLVFQRLRVALPLQEAASAEKRVSLFFNHYLLSDYQSGAKSHTVAAVSFQINREIADDQIVFRFHCNTEQGKKTKLTLPCQNLAYFVESGNIDTTFLLN